MPKSPGFQPEVGRLEEPMKECFVHELVSASLHKLPAYCGKWRGRGRGGQLKSLRNHAWSQMLTPTVDFLLHLLCQLLFQSFNCMYTAQGMNSNLDLVSLLAPPLSAGSRCYRARQSDEANRRPMDAIFTGPRFLWGPVCGSRCLVSNFLRHLWLKLC